MTSYALVAPARFTLDSFARVTGLHPDVVRRLVALGLIEATIAPGGQMWFTPDQVAAVARISRLRSGLSLNYAAIGVVTDLLDRIAELEAALRARRRRTGGTPWI
jgi:DNA-binding transcriptional MerR regulator